MVLLSLITALTEPKKEGFAGFDMIPETVRYTIDLIVSVIAVSVFRSCNPTSGFGWSVAAFLFADFYLLYYIIRRYITKDYCMM